MKRALVFSIVAAASALSAAPASATIIPFLGAPSGGTLQTYAYSHVVNYFGVPDASPDPVVNRLGYWDQGNDGLASSHEVALMEIGPGVSTTWTVIARATIPAGTSATLQDGYRWVSVPDVTLTRAFGTGYTYQIAFDLGSGDDWTEGGSIATANASFGIFPGAGLNGSYTNTNPLAIPPLSSTIANSNYTFGGAIYGRGGNIGYEAPIPEPSTLSMLLFAAIALAPFARRRKGVR